MVTAELVYVAALFLLIVPFRLFLPKMMSFILVCSVGSESRTNPAVRWLFCERGKNKSKKDLVVLTTQKRECDRPPKELVSWRLTFMLLFILRSSA